MYSNLKIRRIRAEDRDDIMAIYKSSRAFMAENGNPDQWGDDYPGIEEVEALIEKDGYVVAGNDKAVAVFAFSDHDDAYDAIKGAWLDDSPYGVIHMLASGGTRAGAGQFVLDHCLNMTGNIRIDTHKDNIPMQRLLEKNGYVYCGTVTFEYRGERLAFQKIKGYT